MPTRAYIRNGNEVYENVRFFRQRYKPACAEAIYEEMKIASIEVDRRTPLKTGKLRSTLKVHPPVVQQKQIKCQMSTGGSEAPYAPFVHENPNAHHPIGRWKYLESVILELRSKMGGAVAIRMRSKLKRR